MNRRYLLGILLVAAVALSIRVVDLDRRPMHADEAVQGLRFAPLLEQGNYRYDPHEFHGPTLSYATLPVAWLRGELDRRQLHETTLRLVPVVFGVGLVLLLPLVADGLGRPGSLWAGLLTALSPAFVYYGRYYIHEMLLVFFSFLLLAACWRYAVDRHWGWAVLAGIALGLMHATKETFVLALAAMLMAGLATALMERGRVGVAGLVVVWRRRVRWRHVALGLGLAAVVSLVFYTSFFTNWRGIVDSVLTYVPWLRRAGGASPHLHPWWFYIERLAFFRRAGGPVWTEVGVLLFAAVGAWASFRGRLPLGAAAPLVRFLAIYSLALTVLYSAISYKTPWCLLGFHHGMILLAGVGASVLFGACRARWAMVCVAVIVAATVAHLGVQACRAALSQSTDRKSPYVYAHTVPDLLRLVQKVDAIASVHPDPERLAIQVMAPGGDYWPLPWYFRGFRNTGWWSEIPEDPYASMMVVSARFEAELDEESNKRWLMVGFFEDRPGVFFQLYVELELWKRHVATLPREED